VITEVVNIKTCLDFDPENNPQDVYIGRRQFYGRRFFAASGWGNPYLADKPGIKRDGTRAEVIQKYRQYILGHPCYTFTGRLPQPGVLPSHLHELVGKRLGCWCKPEPCHGDVLKKLVEQLEVNE